MITKLGLYVCIKCVGKLSKLALGHGLKRRQEIQLANKEYIRRWVLSDTFNFVELDLLRFSIK